MMRSGDTIGGYTLISKLGSGGFGAVWLAEKRSHFVTKKVAVKLPHEDQVNFDAIRQEATLWEQASGHPNVLPIIDADIYDGQVVIVSEYADGGSLADQLKEVGTTSLKNAVEMTIGILNGLEFLHGRGIIHRDIKPQNILLQGNTPRLADFGISRAMQTTAVSSTVIGTDAYMSPEAFDGKRNIQTDIWSVGVVLYQLLKGSLPFPQEHPSERMFAVLTKDFEPLDADVPQSLKEIVQKALQKQPENRYQTTQAMRDDLQGALLAITHPTLAKTAVLTIKQADLPAVGPPSENIVETETFVRPAAPAAIPHDHDERPSVVTQVQQAANERESKVEGNFLRTVSSHVRSSPFMYGLVACFMLLLLIGGVISIGLLPKKDRRYAVPERGNYLYLSDFNDNSTNKYGFKDVNGAVLIAPRFEAASTFSEGYGAVKDNGKWGYINDKGTVVIPMKFGRAGPFREGLAYVSMESYSDIRAKYGFIDRSGNMVIPMQYEEAYPFSEGLAAVKLNGKFGFINKKSEQVIPFKFASGFMFNDGFGTAYSSGPGSAKYALIDTKGNELTPYKYDLVYGISDDLIMVQLDKKYGYLDETGREVIALRYDDGDSFLDGLAKVKLDGREFYINKSGVETKAPANRTY